MTSTHRRRRLVALSAIVAAIVGSLILYGTNVVSASQLHKTWDNIFGSSKVGQVVNGRLLLPSNQWISPIGRRVEVTNGRLLSSTLSPDGTKLAALSWNEFQGFLTVIDVKSGKIVQQIGTGSTKSDPSLGDGTVGPDGPLYSPDGKTLWVPQSADLLRFAVNADGTVQSSPLAIALPLGGPGGAPLPAGMALSADASKLYVALNGYNTLGVIDHPSGATPKLEAKQIPVGNAPRQIAIVGTTAFVSNEGGRPATTSDFTNLSDGTPIVADPRTGGAVTGTVSVVDLTGKAPTASIRVGREPTALYRDGSTLFVANSNNDSVSIIDTVSDKVTQTFHVNPVPHERIGSYPNAISMADPTHLLVSIGRDDAIAVYRYKDETTPVVFAGLLPTDWYPVQVQPDSALGGKIVVTNDKGIGDRVQSPLAIDGPGVTPGADPATGFNTYDDTGTVTTFSLPSDSQLKHYTSVVFADNGWNGASAGSGEASAVVPTHIGGHSPIKHVFVIVKENRTYDQVLGDMPEGNGDPSDAQFGAAITPNQHALAERFGLFDNFYDVGTLSADGHNWIVQAGANDYVEKEFGSFYRSYPASGADALAYQRDGFLWNAAQRADLSVADFAEYANFFSLPASGAPTWTDWYKDSQILEGKAKGPLPVPVHEYRTFSDISSLNAINDPWYPKFDLDVPDQYRVDIWEKAFHKSEEAGYLANLNLMWLPDDHTAGLNSGDPYPIAEQADNDLAVGRIVQDISHSRFWKSTAIFVLEDDTQNGVDHVDGHRGPIWVISPYSRTYTVNDNYYNQVDVVHTIENILGIKPMNQEDGTATPMYSAFTDYPDFRPYTALPNKVPLTLGVPGFSTKMVSTSISRSVSVPAAELAVEKLWVAWSAKQHFTGGGALEDAANPAQLNRLTWYSTHGWTLPYPGDSRILAPNQVPGHDLPAQYLGDD